MMFTPTVKTRILWNRISILAGIVGLVSLFVSSNRVDASDLDREPINYAKAPAENSITRMMGRLAAGKTKLKFDDDRSYLKSVLTELNVSESSQMLVFSKTSMQRDRISPKTPRAIYFNDDVYVGFCLRGGVLEFAAADRLLGTMFYTLDQEPTAKPRFIRQTDNCLICHASSLSYGLPRPLVRSVYTDTDGLPILSSGSFRSDHTSPLKERWGGWYVTGTHGDQTHMGNWIIREKSKVENGFSEEGQNVTDLKHRFTTSFYLTPHSDIVALMVLEHQAEMHGRIGRATLETRMALHYEQELNEALQQPPTHRFDSTMSRIKSVGDSLVKYLLFCDECPLSERVKGSTTFARDFSQRGPRDSKGRSLRDFDLRHRLFRFPCSYLIYSEAFDGMPGEVKNYVLKKLHEILTGNDTSKEFAHLMDEDCRAILEILRETKPNLPAYWR